MWQTWNVSERYCGKTVQISTDGVVYNTVHNQTSYGPEETAAGITYDVYQQAQYIKFESSQNDAVSSVTFAEASVHGCALGRGMLHPQHAQPYCCS